MIGVVFLVIALIILHIVMTMFMVILERDKPRYILCWSIIFLFTSIIGYVVYLLSRKVQYNKIQSLKKKELEDIIYTSLVEKNLKAIDTKVEDDLMNFSELEFETATTRNNSYTYFTNHSKFKQNLIKELKTAENYILLELEKINSEDFEEVIDIIKEKAMHTVMVKLVYANSISRKLLKSLKIAGVKVYKFSKYNAIGEVYGNLRNIISIDGRVAFLGDFYMNSSQLSSKFEITHSILKIEGDILQNVDLNLHKDVVFASGKFMNFKQYKKQEISNTTNMQYVSNQISNNIELLLIKAICSAKKSIQLQLEKFIPTESIMSLLRFAINSNIEVRLIIPLKSNRHGKYYASRAYAKQLALFGANVYLYDGYIKFNAITVDSKYVLNGAFVLDREHIGSSLQNIMLIKDEKAVEHFNKIFDTDINNSYRINDAKFMLFREKFFRNFI